MRNLVDRTQTAMKMLSDSVDIDPQRRGGIPVLKNTRFKVSQLLAQLAADGSVDDLVKNFDLDDTTVRKLLSGLSIILDQPILD